MKRVFLISLSLFCLISAHAQVVEYFTISGSVTDDAGKPVPGVMIKMSEVRDTFYTNEKGFYMVKGPKRSLITYSLAEHEPVTYVIRRDKEINVTMYRTEEDMVNVGYGKQKKDHVTGSIKEISGEELRRNMGGSSNIVDGLDGIPGVSRP